MGIEHEIYVNLTDKHKIEIRELLTGHPFFSKIETVGENTFFEFRKTKSGYDMPDFSVVIQPDCLYIINNQNTEDWADIRFIRQYLIENKIQYKIEEP